MPRWPSYLNFPPSYFRESGAPWPDNYVTGYYYPVPRPPTGAEKISAPVSSAATMAITSSSSNAAEVEPTSTCPVRLDSPTPSTSSSTLGRRFGRQLSQRARAVPPSRSIGIDGPMERSRSSSDSSGSDVELVALRSMLAEAKRTIDGQKEALADAERTIEAQSGDLEAAGRTARAQAAELERVNCIVKVQREKLAETTRELTKRNAELREAERVQLEQKEELKRQAMGLGLAKATISRLRGERDDLAAEISKTKSRLVLAGKRHPRLCCKRRLHSH